MNLEFTLLLFLQASFSLCQNYVNFFEGQDPNPDHDSQIIQLDCSNEIKSLYFDIELKKWQFSSADSCLRSLKDILFYCQRVYPQINVINIQLISEETKFRICDLRKCSAYFKRGTLYRCLHGVFKSKEQLKVPQECKFQHLINKNECQNTQMLKKLANQKCQSIDDIYYMTNYSMIQWCDAFKDGIETFTGIEFVCCPNQLNAGKVLVEDENIDFQQYPINYNFDEKDEIDTKKLVDNFKILDKNETNGESKFMGYATRFFLIGFFMTVFIFVFSRLFKKGQNKDLLRERLNQNLDKNQDSQLDQMQINGYENPTYKFFDEKNLII